MSERSGRLKLALVLAGIYVLLALLFGALGAVLWADMKAGERQALLAILMPRLELSILIILWALLALFIVYPLASLLIRTFTDEGRFSLAGVWGILADADIPAEPVGLVDGHV